MGVLQGIIASGTKEEWGGALKEGGVIKDLKEAKGQVLPKCSCNGEPAD